MRSQWRKTEKSTKNTTKAKITREKWDKIKAKRKTSNKIEPIVKQYNIIIEYVQRMLIKSGRFYILMEL